MIARFHLRNPVAGLGIRCFSGSYESFATATRNSAGEGSFSAVFIIHFLPRALRSALCRSSHDSPGVTSTHVFLKPLTELVRCCFSGSYESFATATLSLIGELTSFRVEQVPCRQISSSSFSNFAPPVVLMLCDYLHPLALSSVRM